VELELCAKTYQIAASRPTTRENDRLTGKKRAATAVAALRIDDV
jgi:hypothetical protein